MLHRSHPLLLLADMEAFLAGQRRGFFHPQLPSVQPILLRPIEAWCQWKSWRNRERKHWKNGEARQLKIIGWSKLNYWLWGGEKTMSFVQGQISDSPASSVHEFLYLELFMDLLCGTFFAYAELPFLFTAKLVSWFPGKDGWNLSSRRGSVGLAIGGWACFFPNSSCLTCLKTPLGRANRGVNHPPVSLGGEI